MNCVDKFINNITPGNYFLTKSMEPSKVNTSGTLWYLKKFLVLYDAIFLSDKIRNRIGVNSIIESFDSYINSLPESQRNSALEFFFPDKANLKKDCRTWYDFAGIFEIDKHNGFDEYTSLVNKYYFVYLMGIGGQSGVKAHIKEKLYSDSFVVNDLKKIISEYKIQHPECSYSNIQIINDYHAALRNERQILFYFGFVHSRTAGAGSDTEFASLTPIGELAIQANSKEFALIWEHQKIKMVSQPVTVNFPSISGNLFCDMEKYQLNYSPYVSILRFLNKNENIVPRFYDLVLSRSNNENIDCIINNYSLFKNKLSEIEKHIASFGIKSDVASEDFQKEIRKYLLGVRSDLPKDSGDNYYGCIRYYSQGWEVSNKEKLDKIIKIYKQIDKYKLKQYNVVFKDTEKVLKKKYLYTAEKSKYHINPKIKMQWDLYNIKIDKVIILSLIVNDYLLSSEVDINKINYHALYKYAIRNFNKALKSVNLTTKTSITKFLKEIVEKLIFEKLSEIELEEDYTLDSVYVNKYSSLNSKDLWNKLKEVSKENVKPKLERIRDGKLISLLYAYHLINNSDENHLIKCECCGKTTFIKNSGDPYLEFHHLIPFNIVDGPDHYENIFGVCPMCHRKSHFIKDSYKKELYDGFNKNNHFNKSILDRLKKLYSQKILKSYHLEYALSEYMINEEEYKLIITNQEGSYYL